MKHLFLLLTAFALLSSCSAPNGQSTQHELESSTADTSESSGFRWHLENGRSYVYSYTQQVLISQRTAKAEEPDEVRANTMGKLKFRAKEGELADVSMVDMEVMAIEEGRDTVRQTPPDLVVQGMASDGSFKTKDTESLFKMLFPLPPMELAEGETADLPMEVPLSANGSLLYAKGQNRLSYLRDERVDGRLCAVLEGVIDVSELDVPQELNGEYRCATTGTGTYYFDRAAGCYVKAIISTEMIALIDQEEADSFGMYMAMSTKSEYEIVLLELE